MKYSKFNLKLLFFVFKNTFLFSSFLFFSCQAQVNDKTDLTMLTGAQQTHLYLDKFHSKNIALVANQTSIIMDKYGKHVHIVDSLLSVGIQVKKVFAPEHGFRGKADAGEHIEDDMDTKTSLPIISLYGKNKKPTESDLKDIDMVVFDIQDVGVRFYTYISTLHYVMEACAEFDIPLLVLDRPNPNRFYVDGPVLEIKNKSFVGMHPVPVVYGLTIGEYAKMINGEKWLNNAAQCKLTVVPLHAYKPDKSYNLPVKPSPNLTNALSINLYPSLCFFEGTNVNAGRGTSTPFQVFGSPFLDPSFFSFQYIPQANNGAKYPKHQNKTCYGLDLRKQESTDFVNLKWLIDAYHNTSNKDTFFNSFFTKLAGTTKLEKQIKQGLDHKQIKASWQADIRSYIKMKKQYHLYSLK